MENTTKITPGDFFMNLGWLATLYGSVISILNLLFETINRVFPDTVSYYNYGYSGGIRWSIAWLVVIFPLYILITRHLVKSYSLDPNKREIWIRKWFVYLTLFLSSVTVIVDIIVLINNFLGGELSTRFLLKIIATLIISGAVFGYYFYDLKKEGANNTTGKIFAWASLVIVLGSLIWAFVVIGSPMQERSRRFDDQRIQHLNEIQSRIINHWQAKGALPSKLSDSEDSIYGNKIPIDPETSEQYEYKVTGQYGFELCAKFNLESMNGDKSAYYYGSESWKHGAGRVCFEKTIDKDLYPVRTSTNLPIKY